VGFYLELIRTVFQAVDGQGKLRNRVVAFTSATRGEGVSYVVNVMAKELAAQTQRRVLLANSETLGALCLADPRHISNHCEETEIDNLLSLSGAESASPVMAGYGRASDWDSSSEYRKACVDALRWNFDYILIDCPSPSVSSDLTTLAPVIDGVAVVVKAAQTRRRQVQHCQEMIESAGGNFLGFVLNQRQYPVPGWLYRRL
jgi:MinD-like ATPase involved in chromosome partitioning or flagellar assembly